MDEQATERQIRLFTEEYIEKLFYFCLRKTGDRHEAEDLASEIGLCVLRALRGGTVPDRLSAWIWQIARNRYSRWAERKRLASRRNAGEETDAADPEDDAPTAEALLVRREELLLLRRELAFISSDYRSIVVAYYIEDRKVKDIAAALGLPEGTVTSKLHRARKILKEGMSMAREFGPLSYRPENIGFVMNGKSGHAGEPWIYLRRALCKNLLLAAYRNPSTAEELAIELGVALPYTEDELGELVDAELMKKNGSRYETNLFIVSAEAQDKINRHLTEITPALTRALIEALEYKTAYRDRACPGWHEGYQSYEDMKWSLLMLAVDRNEWAAIEQAVGRVENPPHLGKWGHTPRPNGGEWDLLGMEEYRGSRPAFVGLHGALDVSGDSCEEEVNFGQFKFQYRKIAERTPQFLSYQQGLALKRIVLGQEEQVPESLLRQLTEYGYLSPTPEGYRPTFCVMRRDKSSPMPSDIRPGYDALKATAVRLAAEHYRFCREVIKREIPDFLRNDPYQIDHACATVCAMRGAVLEEALRIGYLSYDENTASPMLGAYLIL